MSGWRVVVDRQACLGSGMCVGSAPGHFELADGRARWLGDEVGEPDDRLLDAADSCPAEAITIRDVGTSELLAPT